MTAKPKTAAAPRPINPIIPDPLRPKRVLIVRWGAIGDVIQASSLFPQLVEDGWQVYADVNEMGEQVLRHDPHLSGILVSPLGRVPPEKLTDHVQHRALGFDKLILLNDMTEGALIKQPHNIDYYWSNDARRRECNRNYVQYLHDISDVSYAGGCRQKFYATEAETAQAKAFAGPRGPLIFWAIAGSHQHKVWPGLARAMTRVLHETDAHIVVSGGPGTEELWQSTLGFLLDYHGDVQKRMTALVATHPIRAMLALAQAADIVVGPETGILNAMAMERMRKILLLSHSSKENLSRDWVATTTIEPDPSYAPCWPCHRMHPSLANCPQDQLSGLAKCMTSISVDRVVNAIKDGLAALPSKVQPVAAAASPAPAPEPVASATAAAPES